MHEATLALEVLNIVEDTRRHQNFQRVMSLDIEVGQLSCVEASALQFALMAVSSGTALENATINILPVPGRLCCKHCGREFFSATVFTVCPQCQRSGARIIGGDDMRVTQIEVSEVQYV